MLGKLVDEWCHLGGNPMEKHCKASVCRTVFL